MAEVRARLRDRSDETVCPLCRDDLVGAVEPCRGCATAYHSECLSELGGCSTLGCQLQGKLPSSFDSWFCRACHGPIENSIRRRRCACSAYLHDACVEAHTGSGCPRAADLNAPLSVRPFEELLEGPPSSTQAGIEVEPFAPDLRRVSVGVGRWTLEQEELFYGLLAFAPAAAFGMDMWESGSRSVLGVLIWVSVFALGVWLNHRFGRHVVGVEFTPDELRIKTRNVFRQERCDVHTTSPQVSGEAVNGGIKNARRLAHKPRYRLRVGGRSYTVKTSLAGGTWLVNQLRRWGPRPREAAPDKTRASEENSQILTRRRAVVLAALGLGALGGAAFWFSRLEQLSVLDLVRRMGVQRGTNTPITQEFERRGAAAVPELRRLLVTPRVFGPDVVRALVATRCDEAREGLLEALGNHFPDTRIGAIQALRATPDPRFDAALQRLVNDPNLNVRAHASDVLGWRRRRKN